MPSTQGKNTLRAENDQLWARIARWANVGTLVQDMLSATRPCPGDPGKVQLDTGWLRLLTEAIAKVDLVYQDIAWNEQPPKEVARKLLAFMSPGCSSCAYMQTVLRKERISVPVEWLDTETHTDLVERYGVDDTPWFVLVNEKGSELGHTVGLMPLRALKRRLGL